MMKKKMTFLLLVLMLLFLFLAGIGYGPFNKSGKLSLDLNFLQPESPFEKKRVVVQQEIDEGLAMVEKAMRDLRREPDSSGR